MSEDTFVEAEIWSVARTNQGNAVLIRPIGADVAVPIFIGPLETQSIVIGLGGVQVPRPLTHDLAVNLIAACGRKVTRVEISDLKEGTFYGRIVLDSASGEEAIDSRPSDALAIAVRVKCRVFIAEHVVEEAGVPVELMAPKGEADSEGLPEGPSDLADLGMDAPAMEASEEFDILGGQGVSSLAGSDPGRARQDPEGRGGERMNEERRRLIEALEQAVANEDYEAAAVIRDRLRELEDEL
jgi:uncharacterized protein